MNPKKIAAFSLGPLGGALLGFITLPIITWFFSQEDIGRLAMLNVVISFSILLFSLGLDQAYVREFHEIKSKPALFKTTLLPGLVLIFIALGVLLCFDNVISLWLFEIDSVLLSLLVSVAVLSAFLSRFLSLILRMNEQGFAYSMSQLLPKLLLILIIGGYVVFSVSKSITNLVLANVSATLFVCIIYAWNTRSEWLLGIKESIDYNYLKSLVSFGIPLIFGGLAFWGLTATDKILLKELSDFEQLGLYSVAVSFAAAATIFQSVFSTIWAPMVYRWAAAGENLDKIYKVNRYVLLAVIVLFCLAGLFSWVVTLILPSNYNDVQWILIPCLGFPLLYTLSETTVVGIGVTRRSGFAMLAALLALVVNLLGNWWLIPDFGAAGAAVSTCVSFWVFLLLRTEFSIYVWKPFPRLQLYSYTALLVIGASLSTFYGKNYTIPLLAFWLITLVFSLFFFRKEVAEIFIWIANASK
ncbi:lipopolysaccharide biosynthesis protein [Pseudoalteromonas sp. APC 3250]|uniref:lipopolysaccharide biosynthesis protein n=1 Tax=Pseudoalteromonas sp. APC 3250 TaxID=3035184 RepID=UPI0025B4C5A0|nr:lipopolysaccharide biosynthesis protein [Pseudoalteromonas sp. APC 3250]MDN3412316.1 lipopolysaccharide biosynthesis protein [Pseudoalteromonas sp. APC 3250]